MRVLGEDYDVHSKDHIENTEAMHLLNAELDNFVARNQEIPQRELDKMTKKGKFAPIERINRMLDRGSPFLEIGQLAGHDQGVPTGNILTGIGTISGQKCMIVANNYVHKGGAYFPITVKKHLRA